MKSYWNLDRFISAACVTIGSAMIGQGFQCWPVAIGIWLVAAGVIIGLDREE